MRLFWSGAGGGGVVGWLIRDGLKRDGVGDRCPPATSVVPLQDLPEHNDLPALSHVLDAHPDNMTAHTDGTGHTTVFGYPAFDELQTVTNPGGTRPAGGRPRPGHLDHGRP